MRNSSVSLEGLDALIEQIELLFGLSQQLRTGFVHRGVDEGHTQRMIGHIGVVAIVSHWFNLEFHLKFSEGLLIRLCYYHDMAKALMGDPVRVQADRPGRPWNVVAAMISRFVKRGHSLKERREELDRAIDALSAYLREETPEVSNDVSASLELYFLRKGEGSDVARFVADVGQVVDVHAALWYAAKGEMKPTRYNIRSFTYELRKRIKHPAVRAYWKRLTQRYMDIMLPAYDYEEKRVLAQ